MLLNELHALDAQLAPFGGDLAGRARPPCSNCRPLANAPAHEAWVAEMTQSPIDQSDYSKHGFDFG